MVRRRTVLFGIAATASAIAGAGVASAYRRAMRQADDRSAPRLSQLAPTRHGAIEYAVAGDGPTVLMLHGTGGGFDQGLAMAAPLLDLGYRLISPSRFGYLRTALPADPSPEAQADALADLLDHLGIDAVTVAGGSAGAIPSAAFAARHPERTVAHIALVPALLGPDRAIPAPWSATQEAIAKAVLGSDFLFWAAIAAMPDTLTRTLLASDPALLETASPEEQARVKAVLEGILPVSRKTEGLLNDAFWTSSPVSFDLSVIRAPTLAISAEDDFYETALGARYVAKTVHGAQLVVFPTGGHVWIGRNKELFDTIDGFLQQAGARQG